MVHCTMLKWISLASILLASSLFAAQIPYFDWTHPNYKEYNPYKADEIEIREWRGKPREDIEKALLNLGYPLLSQRGPYLEVDVNGRHTYIQKTFKPTLFPRTGKFPKTEVPSIYEQSKKNVEQPLYVVGGRYNGVLLSKLVVVYENCEDKWLCYDAYWKFVKPPPPQPRTAAEIRAAKKRNGVVAEQIRAAKARGATNIHISPLHGLPVGRPKVPESTGCADNRTMLELIRDLEAEQKKFKISDLF